MSMFSFPADMNTNEMMKSMNAMTDWTKTADFTVSPLMVYPLGAAAAATAVGFGIASQMTGMMMGAMQGAMQSQGALMGQHPDLSWMMPGLVDNTAPDEDEAGAQPAARTKSADIVELKQAPKAVAVKVKTKASAAKSVKAKAAPARKVVTKPAVPAKDAAVAVVEKLKSDAKVAAAVASEPVTVSKSATTVPATTLEPEDFRRPAEIDKPETPDDLKLISGIGPKLEQVLNGLGVWTFAQIAGWKPEEAAWVDDYLQFGGRVERDGWISRAGALAKGGATAQ